ncbi:hypothetical protein A943_05805 [Bacillus sp. CPSM8]|nr:hypothetical protein A943_05805 [Bacillus sp. CPSM8]KRT88836.1 hypothetical protein ACH97_220830 [Bacillus paralicheniformis]MBG9884011.1 hypothetical protein [Bacillus paralicheniformis]TWK86205.1 hypothetical protein CHCC20331_1358 [Bacillus paralicheniformis]
MIWNKKYCVKSATAPIGARETSVQPTPFMSSAMLKVKKLLIAKKRIVKHLNLNIIKADE